MRGVGMLSSIGRFVSLLVAAVVGGIIASWFFRAPPPQQPSASAPQFYASPEALGVEVTDMPAAARVELGGYVEARDVVRLTAQAPGRIVYTAGQEGDRVGAGQVVASLDDDALRPEYRAAWANLTSDTVASENAQTQLYHRLYGQPTTSPMGGPAYDAYERSFTPVLQYGAIVHGRDDARRERHPLFALRRLEHAADDAAAVAALLSRDQQRARRLRTPARGPGRVAVAP